MINISEELSNFSKRLRRQDLIESSDVESRIKIHDQTQIQIEYNFRATRGNLRKSVQYQLDAYFFLPPQLGKGHRQQFGKDFFYQSLKPFLRFNAPLFTKKDFLDLQGSRWRSPISKLEALFSSKNVLDSRSGIDPNEVIHEARVFACSFEVYLTKGYQKASRRKTKKSFDINNYDEHLRDALKIFRKFSVTTLPNLHLLNDNHKELLLNIHEYSFHTLVAYYCREMSTFGDYWLASTPATKNRHLAWLRLFRYIAKRNGYLWVNQDSTERKLEEWVARKSLLKKIIWQNLFIHYSTRKPQAFWEQMIFMLVAGTTAAVGALYQLAAFRTLNDAMGVTEQQTTTILLIIIIGYIVKDRIKDLGKSRLAPAFLKKLPDYADRLFYINHKGRRVSLGRVKEWVTSMAPKEVPQHVLRSRQCSHAEQQHPFEAVSRYVRSIKIKKAAVLEFGHPLFSIKDMIRLDISEFTLKLDDPYQEEIIMDPKGQSLTKLVPKLYYLDIVLFFQEDTRFGGMRPLETKHIRLVLNKQGLVRID